MKYLLPRTRVVDWLILWVWMSIVGCSTIPQSLLRGQSVKIPFRSSTALPFNREVIFNFDIDQRYYTDHFTVEEAIDTEVAKGGLTGGIHFVSGHVKQAHSFIVLVRSSASAEDVLDDIVTTATSHELRVSNSEHCAGETRDAKVDVSIVIIVRPHSLQFGGYGTTITSNSLDIKLWPGLWFETYHMKLSSHSGSIISSELQSFTAHSIHVETTSGSVTGNWSLPGSITLITKNGSIDIDLLPKQWSSGPTTGGDLTARSTTGNIDIRMPTVQEFLSLRNGTTDITSILGHIRATLMHSAVTNVRTQVGSINITLVPYWAFPQWGGIQHNYITTEIGLGSMWVDVLPAIVDSYYEILPLCFTNSTHRVDGGYMNLKYPRDWCGRAHGSISYGGTLNVSGEDFEVIEQDSRHVRLQRPPYGSNLYFEVEGGTAELLMK